MVSVASLSASNKGYELPPTRKGIRCSALAKNAGARAVADAANVDKAVDCPYTKLKSIIAPNSPTTDPNVAPSAPGPAAFSLQSMMDVSSILSKGIHGAMLDFDQKWGSTCRFANPADLNGASGWIFINTPDNVQHVCMENVRNYQRRYLPDVYKFATHEKGILGSQGAYNMKHRRMCQPPFRNRNLLREFSSIISDRATFVADTLQSAATQHAAAGSDGPLVVDVALHTQRLTLDIVGLTAFSHDFNQPQYLKLAPKLPCQVQRMRDELQGVRQPSEQDRLLWAINTFGEVLADVFITPMPVLRALDLLGFRSLRKLSEASDVMRSSMLGVISERRARLAAGQRGPDDLLGVLLEATDDDSGAPLTDEELWEDVHDIMGAGHETTATTTAAAIHCVASHPEVERRLRSELQAVCGDAAPTFDDLDRLPYLQQVVQEVLRLYPAIPVFPREAAAGDVLPSGHRVDAGDVVFMSSYALGRSPRLWDKPLAFDPDRFAPDAAAELHRFQWMPFGGGPRMCLGATWAQMSVALMTATLLQRLTFECLPDASQLLPVGYDITMNFNDMGGLRMRCAARG